MIEIRIPKEIQEYKERILIGLTLRQILSVAAMALINVPAYFLLAPLIGKDLTSWVILVNAAPIAVVGFVKIGGMQFEEFAKVFITTNFIYPQNRKYKSENIFEEIANEVQSEKDAAILEEFLKAQNEERMHLQEEERQRRKLAASVKPSNTPQKASTYNRISKEERRARKMQEREHKWKEKEFVGSHLRTDENNEKE